MRWPLIFWEGIFEPTHEELHPLIIDGWKLTIGRECSLAYGCKPRKG